MRACKLPILHLGKRRESLTGDGEAYKQRVLDYLRARDYYIKQDSFVEGTFPDAILTKKNEEKEYWLESKATILSLSNSSFLNEFGDYLLKYLDRTKENKFTLIIALIDYRNPSLFESIFDDCDEVAILDFLESIGKKNVEFKETITKYGFDEIKEFFESIDVIRSSYPQLIQTIDRLSPTPSKEPSLTEAEYASRILDNYTQNKPLIAPDTLCSNLLAVQIPDQISVAETKYREIKDIFENNPRVRFPLFRKVGQQIYSFSELNEYPLNKIIFRDSIEKIDISEWDLYQDNRNIILYLIYRWLEDICDIKELEYNDRTKSYYFIRDKENEVKKSITWKPRNRTTSRDVVIPMRKEGEINFWSHRATNISVLNYWGRYYIKINPRWLFSPDGLELYDGEITDRLDRAYRKSNFNRNLNQYNDFLFWKSYLFSSGGSVLDQYTSNRFQYPIQIGKNLKIPVNVRPNIVDEKKESDPMELNIGQFLTGGF